MSCILTGFDIIDEITKGIENFSLTFDTLKREVLPTSLRFEGYKDTRTEFFNKNYFGKKLVALNMKAYLNCYEGRHWGNLKKYNRKLYEFQDTQLVPLTNLYKDLCFYIYQCSEFEKGKEPELLTKLINFRDNLARYIIENSEEYKKQKWGESYKETL